MQAVERRDPYGVALGAVRQFARSGRFFPGAPIVVTDLAAEVGLSATPVREALACLAGEGLIERRRGQGYFYPALKASDIIDLYELQLGYLHAALMLHPRGLASLRKAVVGLEETQGVQPFFEAVITQSANSALILAHQRLVQRLWAVLQAEHVIDGGTPEMVSALIKAVAAGRLSGVLSLLAEHHDRRCARVADLLFHLSR